MGDSIVAALQVAFFLLIALGAFLVIARRDRRGTPRDRRLSQRGGRRKGESASKTMAADAPTGSAATGAPLDFRHQEAGS
jgi:hypothetical protein